MRQYKTFAAEATPTGEPPGTIVGAVLNREHDRTATRHNTCSGTPKRVEIRWVRCQDMSFAAEAAPTAGAVILPGFPLDHPFR
jgi:hypothetical protein